jgi:hypothetical protein
MTETNPHDPDSPQWFMWEQARVREANAAAPHQATSCRDFRCEPHHPTETLLDYRDDLSDQLARHAERYGSPGPVRQTKAIARGHPPPTHRRHRRAS